MCCVARHCTVFKRNQIHSINESGSFPGRRRRVPDSFKIPSGKVILRRCGYRGLILVTPLTRQIAFVWQKQLLRVHFQPQSHDNTFIMYNRGVYQFIVLFIEILVKVNRGILNASIDILIFHAIYILQIYSKQMN